MKRKILLPLFLSTTFIIGLRSMAQSDTVSHHIDSLIGTYSAWKWTAEDVTEMSSAEARGYLKKLLIIHLNQFKLFNDKFEGPTYDIETVSKAKFFSDYDIDEKKFSFLPGNLRVLTVSMDDDRERKIIILKKALIVNFRGYFYFFRKNTIQL
jgi:hypothetical protein